MCNNQERLELAIMDQYQYLGDCPRTPPLTQH